MLYVKTATGMKPVSVYLSTSGLTEKYVETETYVAGDFCVHDMILYKCTAQTTGTFDSTKWEQVYVCEELETANENIDAIGIAIASHAALTNNPHSVTAAQIGAATTADLNAHTGNTNNPHSVTTGQIGAATAVDLSAHTGNTNNPHGVTRAQLSVTEQGKLKIGDSEYTLRVGSYSSGETGYITFSTQ